MTSAPPIRVLCSSLTKEFKHPRQGSILAVDQLSFEARANEIFGLLGVNGAGKTTTLRLLATMLKPTAGDARVGGHSITREPQQVRQKIGFLSAATSLYGRLSAREMIAYFGRLNGMRRETIESRTRELFDLFQMNDFAERRCDKLSTGMKQKVSIVRTVLHDPEVMIFDEPTAGLDVLASRTIVDFVRDCRTRGKCVLFSTHSMSEAEKLCDRVGVIHDGKLLACATVEALRSRTPSGRLEDAFVGLVGAPA